MNAPRDRKPSGAGAAVPGSGERPRDYPSVRDGVRGELAALCAEPAITATRLVGDLAQDIRLVLDAGRTFTDVARVFGRWGVDVSPDAIRVAQARQEGGGRKRKPGATQSRSLAPPAPQPDQAHGRAVAPAGRILPGPDLGDRPTEREAVLDSDPEAPEPRSGGREPSIGRRLD